MGDVIQYIPPTPRFDDRQAEEAGTLQTPLADAFERWNSAFLTGAKSITADWDAYVKEMKSLGIEKFVDLYNANL
jgi:putative aldouronate transport system substrate-binding protein